MWKLLGKLAVEYFSGFTAAERLDHRPIINNLFTIVKRERRIDATFEIRLINVEDAIRDRSGASRLG
jgi:hypothetical protein